MAKIRLKQVEGIGRIQVSHAFTAFIRHCQLKNLALYSIRYYQDNLGFFFELMPKIKYVDEISQDSINEFIGILMDRDNKVTAINARLRALFVFLRYCFSQEYFELLRIRCTAIKSSLEMMASCSSKYRLLGRSPRFLTERWDMTLGVKVFLVNTSPQ